MAENKEVDVNEQIKNRMEKLSALQAEGNDPFEITKYDVTCHTSDIKDNFDEMDGKDVSIAGRLMAKRVMGKASFANVADRNGNIQLYVSKDDLGDEGYKAFKKFDIGDIVGVKGRVFKTQKGEISVHVTEIILLVKSLQVLPEKYHGLRDTDQRYRQRYVDLIVNPEVRTTFEKRSAILCEITAPNGRGGSYPSEAPAPPREAAATASKPLRPSSPPVLSP